MKIAVVSPYALDVPGGVQQQVMELSARLCDAGNDAFVVAPRASNLPNALDVGDSAVAEGVSTRGRGGGVGRCGAYP